MSERMIELQRAKLGLPPAGSSPSTPAGNSQRTPKASPVAAQLTPQEAAAQHKLEEDAEMQKFLHRLQRRDDSNPNSDMTSGPTVPTALSRRILNRQGVGYLDSTVAAAVSASADRFLATVLQQSIACRDQRLKGAEMAREAARHRKRHMQHYAADSDDRRRRKDDNEKAREAHFQTAIAAGEALKKGGSSTDADKKKKAAKKADGKASNGSKAGGINSIDDDEESYDSIDEEEEYYQDHLGPVTGKLKGEDDEDDDMLLLRDLARPLEAWDFHLTGKESLAPQDPTSDAEDEREEGGEDAESSAPPTEENGNDDDLSLTGMDSSAKGSAKSEDGDTNVK